MFKYFTMFIVFRYKIPNLRLTVKIFQALLIKSNIVVNIFNVNYLTPNKSVLSF